MGKNGVGAEDSMGERQDKPTLHVVRPLLPVRIVLDTDERTPDFLASIRERLRLGHDVSDEDIVLVALQMVSGHLDRIADGQSGPYYEPGHRAKQRGTGWMRSMLGLRALDLAELPEGVPSRPLLPDTLQQ